MIFGLGANLGALLLLCPSFGDFMWIRELLINYSYTFLLAVAVLGLGELKLKGGKFFRGDTVKLFHFLS